ncbi:MAG: type VI secretion system protein TssA [Planctomycetota bacterium]|nr:type VI secretion system protein TssA [Planctomycetaceae bacterium]MDQ3331210.1 type VI secretion system protein TssA [Planctomycetota bacterium]
MPTPTLLQFDGLLSPISGANPSGESLKYQPLWDEITAARKGHTDAVAEGADSEPDWRRVQALTCDALETKTKDLQIAGWLTEALVHTGGFAGLRDGLRLLRGLVEGFWVTMYPQLEEGDPEVRAAPLYWLTDAQAGARLPGLVREVGIVLPDNQGEIFSTASKQSFQTRSQRDGEDSDEFASRSRDAQDRANKFQAAVVATPDTFFITLREDIAECFEEVRTCEKVIDEKLGVEHAPSFSAIRAALEDCSEAVEQICRSRGLTGEADAGSVGFEDQNGVAAAVGGLNGAAGGGNGPLRTRAEAVTRLREVVDFFKRTEPHSPVALLIDRAVRWANSPFEAVLAELIQDDSTLSRIRDTLGLPPSEDN